MTIAMCYMSPEGIVLGADSTASLITPQQNFHHFDHAQKLYELGRDSSVGVLTWGMGGIGSVSHRTLLGILADDLAQNPPTDVADISSRWTTQFWAAYSGLINSPDAAALIAKCKALDAKTPFVAGSASPLPSARTQQEENEYQGIIRFFHVGFCIAGYVPPDRTPKAFYVTFDPLKGQPSAMPIPVNSYGFWGAPNMIKRLIWGFDDDLSASVVASGKWSGTALDLQNVLRPHRLEHAILPIRDVIDFVHACIYSTIKAMKFSHGAQICGGPIEIAVISTDRKFRWVRHKDWDAAIKEGERS